MAGLTNDEVQITQAYIDGERERLAEVGLSLEISSDAGAWRAMLDAAPGVRSLSRTFDPDLNDMRRRDVLWLSFVDRDGNAVACNGSRLVRTDDFINEWVTTWRIFGDTQPHLDIYTLEFVDSLPTFAGNVGYSGGSWVHPEWRNLGLSGKTSRLCRTFVLRHFCADYYIGFIESAGGKPAWAQRKLGLLNQRRLSVGLYPAREGRVDANIVWANKEEILSMCESNDLRKDRHLQRVI